VLSLLEVRAEDWAKDFSQMRGLTNLKRIKKVVH